MSLKNPVRPLNPEVARKIAAGEVIDRPNAIIRELMDNAIDSGATEITVEICGGGIEKIRVIDNGCGMTKEDLEKCARPHATSKISTETDLMNLSTLGFRGEALASIASVARLSILSGGWKMRASITEDHILEPAAEIKGTIVQSEGLFENFPARRKFLKRPATESTMCKNTFIEKVIPRPDIAFRLIIDGETKIDLPAGQSIKERFISASSYNEDAALFYELSAKSSSKENGIYDWEFTVVTGEPGVNRPTKKDIYIYANGRRIQEYSLVQAVEYGGQGFFPNGTYPVAVVFVNVNPSKIDFNIHPAKKEARFYDIADLHHGLSSTLKRFFQSYTYSNFIQDKTCDNDTPSLFESKTHTPEVSTVFSMPVSESTQNTRSDYSYKNTSLHEKAFFQENGSDNKNTGNDYQTHIKYKTPSYHGEAYEKIFSAGDYKRVYNSTDSLSDIALAGDDDYKQNEYKPETQNIRFIGACLGTFLLAEKNNCLYCIDQHAAHERILFDKIMNSQGKKQPLLIPYKIHTESKTQDNQLRKLKDRLSQTGFDLEEKENGLWEVTSVPERWTGSQYELQSLLFVKQVEPEQIIRSIAAMTACKAAVKDGYALDNLAAEELVKKAFELEDPHCPHGRPVYTVISREELFKLVKRT